MNNYNNASGGYDKYCSSGWQSASKPASSSWSDRGWDRSSGGASGFDRERWGQFTGSDRFSSFSRAGGGGWDGFRGRRQQSRPAEPTS